MRIGILTPPPGPDLRPDLADTYAVAAEVAAALRALGHMPAPVEYADPRNCGRLLMRLGLDLVFNLVDDPPEGPDKAWRVTAMLDDIGLAYTGARTDALVALADKRKMKAELHRAGLPVPPRIPRGRAARFIVKSAIEHASVGLDAGSVVVGREAAESLIAEKGARHGGAWFAEAYVEGREFGVSLIETPDRPIVLPIAEIGFTARHAGPAIVGYQEKWAPESNAYIETPRLFGTAGPPLEARLGGLALAAWDCFSLSGYARVDFRATEAGEPVILEVNANPGLAADAGFCAAAAAAGMSQTQVIEAIVDAARA